MGKSIGLQSRDTQKNKRTERFIFSTVFVIVAGLILWQAVDYFGIVGWLAELQFKLLKSYYPPFTFLILLALVCSPFILYRIIARLRSDDKHRSPETRRWRSVTRATRLMRTLFWLTAACAIAAIVSLVMISDLPSDTGDVNHVTVGTPSAVSPVLGKTELDGDVNTKETAAFYAHVPTLTNATYFAPLSAHQGAGSVVHYFVEMQRTSNPKAEFIPTHVGVLARNALPGEIMAIYHGAGYRVEKPYYVLYATAQSMRMPYYIFAAEFGGAALLFLVFGFLQRWHRNAVRRALEREAADAV